MSNTFNLINTSNISLLTETSYDSDNLELLTVKIKIDQHTSKDFSIKKHQNIVTAAKNFCVDNKMNPSLVNCISNTIQKAITSINEVFNTNLTTSIQNKLTGLQEIYTGVKLNTNEICEFNLKKGIEPPRLSNLSCITLLNSDDENDLNYHKTSEDQFDNLNRTM
jgi:hypothetical protein